MAQASHRASHRDHCQTDFRELIEARHEVPVLFLEAEYAFGEISLPVLLAINSRCNAGFGLRVIFRGGGSRLSTVAIAVVPQGLGLVAFVSE